MKIKNIILLSLLFVGSVFGKNIVNPEILTVSELPKNPKQMIYNLDTANTVYPKGFYLHDGIGWTCIHQIDYINLPTWNNIVYQRDLVPGVVYFAEVGSEIVLSVYLQTTGTTTILIDNSVGPYNIELINGYFGGGSIELSPRLVKLTVDSIGGITIYDYAPLKDLPWVVPYVEY